MGVVSETVTFTRFFEQVIFNKVSQLPHWTRLAKRLFSYASSQSSLHTVVLNYAQGQLYNFSTDSPLVTSVFVFVYSVRKDILKILKLNLKVFKIT
jgi:hypothetical protein